MKKVFLSLCIIAVSFLCTACINNLAIQELNNKAKEYLKSGDAQSAVCRLKSSLDLDGNFFETNYNLAIAYIELKDWNAAKDAMEHAIKLNSEFADCYYSLGFIYENISDDIINKEEKIDKEYDENGNIIKEIDNTNLTQENKQEIVLNYQKAIEAYKTYTSKTADLKTKNEIINVIENLNLQIEKYSTSDIAQ